MVSQLTKSWTVVTHRILNKTTPKHPRQLYQKWMTQKINRQLYHKIDNEVISKVDNTDDINEISNVAYKKPNTHAFRKVKNWHKISSEAKTKGRSKEKSREGIVAVGDSIL